MNIRTNLQPGDLSFLLSSHTEHYLKEHGYTVPFEYYVGKAINEFYENYDPTRSCIWIVEENGYRLGSLVLQDRGTTAQLRLFLLLPAARGHGVGKALLRSFIAFCKEKTYRSAYFWTTDEQLAAARLYRSVGFQITEERTSETFGRPILEQRYELVF